MRRKQASLAASIAAYQALQQSIAATSADPTLAQLNANLQVAQQQLAALSSIPDTIHTITDPFEHLHLP